MKHLPLILILSGIIFAFTTRIIIPWNDTFTPFGIVLNTPDAYCMLRYADAFPNIIKWDNFSNYPIGSVALKSIWPVIVAVIARLFSTSNLIVLMVLPPILFFGTLCFVYQIAKRLFSELIAAGAVFILCLLPGEILNRTMLGAGDYHCWEIFLVTLIMMLIFTAINNHGLTRWSYLFPILAWMTVYWYSWAGALMLPFIFVAALFAFLWLAIYTNWKKRTGLLLAFLGLVLLAWRIFPSTQSIFAVDFTQTIAEAYPLLWTQGHFDISVFMAYFNVTFYIVLIGLGWLIYKVLKYHKLQDIIFASWTFVTFAMMIASRRFDYYFAVNAAILVSYVSITIIQHIGSKQIIRIAIAIAIVICLPLARQSIMVAQDSYGRPSVAWLNTTAWLLDHSENEAAYYTNGLPAYGVFSWWDYGYWITGIGHQAAYANNGSGDSNMASSFLLSQNMNRALGRLQEKNYRYIVIDSDMFELPALYSLRLEKTFMYLLYNEVVPGAKLVNWSGNVKTFEIVNGTYTVLQSDIF